MTTASSFQEQTAVLASPQKQGILVVDDDASVRQILEVGLQFHGFLVWAASSGPEAVHLYQTHRDHIALVLLDVKMPGLDGPATLQALEQVNPEVRSAFMSGNTGHYSENDLLQRGARSVFRKPFDLAQLAGKLRQIIEN